MQKLKHIIEYVLGRSLLGFLGILPLPVASFVGAKLGAFFATLPINANTTARRNISIAFPEKSEQEIRKVQYEATKNFMQTLLEMPSLYKLNKKNFHKYIKVIGLENLSEDKSRLILTAHYGNWETVLKTIAFNNIPMASIYRRANNAYIDKYVTKMRSQDTGLMIPKGNNGGRKLIKAIKENMCAGFLNDQKMSDGIDSTFFGQPVKSASSIAELATKYNRQVCPVFCTRNGYGKFTVTFSKPIDVETTGDKKQDVSDAIQSFNNIIEEEIRKEPNLWLWHHKRFRQVKA